MMIMKSLNDYLIDYHVFFEVGKIDEYKVRQRAAYITTNYSGASTFLRSVFQHSQVFCKIGLLKYFPKLRGKHL